MAVLDRKNHAVLSERERKMVRHAQTGDLEQLLTMYRELRVSGMPGITWSEAYPSDDDIRNDLTQHALYVLEWQGEVVASLATEMDEVKDLVPCDPQAVSCEISRVAVRDADVGDTGSPQGRGISGDSPSGQRTESACLSCLSPGGI